MVEAMRLEPGDLVVTNDNGQTMPVKGSRLDFGSETTVPWPPGASSLWGIPVYDVNPTL